MQMQVQQRQAFKAAARRGRSTTVRALPTMEKPKSGQQNIVETTHVTSKLPALHRDVDQGTIRQKMEEMIRNAQDSICAAIEEVDGGGKFRTDAWQRAEGGGGISKVMQQGNVWEKAGVAVSVVYGEMPVVALKTANPDAKVPKDAKPGQKVPFFAAGISSVMHPYNPHCPTMHFNYRYFETFPIEGLAGQWWFGGGTDITPSYLVPEDLKHFHGTYKAVCDKHDATYYAKMKAACDEYFLIKHRGEMRGMGGIFYEGLNDKSQEEILAFSRDCAAAVAPAYCPIVSKHKNDAFTPAEKEWQQVRRGRYVEYNLIYDRGTIFGLQTGGRVESILMSMPLTARWEYDHHPAAGSREADFLDAARNPRNWA
mmetsp:Transcript_10171/g.25353  ORF Transcript_10171/g.25353 Transcript_10171/m.25353 type:complete len:369 (-) Transcript_10171:747-1853(-)|eukprot:CAMPEP_0202865162 /NCGR_PEP_ID=MMETSP1391-20130828/5310_1 /ASSEMBLY_ACC=CAM_ASM_000867 /TAXON_ID=1034604 /ORGANISM="Chlamydomonas leiostraca, Strain SAG 11-49" /LENGTH=368 /DNA_ID=CAMNT_0049544967 /DNA_START=48 /DNA_END=1154 /DNA_ORIENTATION=+